MKLAVTHPKTTLAKIEVALTEAELAPYVERTFNRLRRDIKAAGFRPGKAPNHIIERQLGANTIQNEVLEAAVEQTYARALTEHGLTVVANPQISLAKFVPYSELEYSAEVEIMPPVTLADYKSVKVKQPDASVSAKDIEDVIAALRQQAATLKDVDRPAKPGDTVTLDYVGRKDGKPFEGGSDSDHTMVLGEGKFLAEFEKNLEGVKAGETKKFNLTFPKDYSEASLAGQKVEFTADIKKVSEAVLPELDEAFFKRFGSGSLDDMKQAVRKQLETEKAEQAQFQYELEVVDVIADKSKFDLPEALVAQRLEQMKGELEQNLASSGLNLEKYLKVRNQTNEQLEAEMRPEAEKRVRRSVVLTEVAKAEKVQVTDAELDEELAALKTRYTDPKVLEELEHDHTRHDVYNQLLGVRTIAKIMKYVESK